MCRHLGYWGPPIAPADLALDAAHSLLAQCTAAREMSWGYENLDGWGYVAFDNTGRADHYRTSTPMPVDTDGHRRLRQATSARFVVHARQKTPGASTDERGSAPFFDGTNRFFAHNGFVPGFRDGAREQLLGRLSAARRQAIEGDADSEVLFALVLDRIDAGQPAVEALSVLAEAYDEFGGRYNSLFTDGTQLIASRLGSTLYVHDNDAVTIASEALDDRRWDEIPDAHVVIIDDEGIRKERW